MHVVGARESTLSAGRARYSSPSVVCIKGALSREAVGLSLSAPPRAPELPEAGQVLGCDLEKRCATLEPKRRRQHGSVPDMARSTRIVLVGQASIRAAGPGQASQTLLGHR
eukprot:2804337-Rhodomonas_salina.1